MNFNGKELDNNQKISVSIIEWFLNQNSMVQDALLTILKKCNENDAYALEMTEHIARL